MRILKWAIVQKEIESSAAFNMVLLKAIDPRLITHRPRDPEKTNLMKELGMDTGIRDVAKKARADRRKGVRSAIPSSWAEIDVEVDS